MFWKKDSKLFRSSPNQVACTSKPTRSLLVLHTWNAAGKLERNRLSHLASPWILPLTCKSTTWKLPRPKGRIDCAGHGKSTLTRPGAPTSHEPQARGTIEKSRKGTDFLPQAGLICSATGLLKIVQSYPVSDIFNPNRHLPHPPTSERCSDFQKSLVIVDHP